MIDAKLIDDLAHRISEAVPPGVRNVQADLEKNLRAAIQSVFARVLKPGRHQGGTRLCLRKRLLEKYGKIDASEHSCDRKSQWIEWTEQVAFALIQIVEIC